jgi:hypothetical protein
MEFFCGSSTRGEIVDKNKKTEERVFAFLERKRELGGERKEKD